eukprot:2741095-Pyramimonas_sp.AAC.1
MPMASSRRSSARAGARWRRDWDAGSDQARPCTSGCNAAWAGRAPTWGSRRAVAQHMRTSTATPTPGRWPLQG